MHYGCAPWLIAVSTKFVHALTRGLDVYCISGAKLINNFDEE